MSLSEERKQWEQQVIAVPMPVDIECSNESIAGVSCLWVSDINNSSDKVIVFLHGGGLVCGSALTHRHLAARMTTATGLTILLVDYRLLPENEYPAPLEDVLSVYNDLLAGDRYSSDQIVFGGDSSGAGLLLAAMVQLRNSETPLPCCAFSLSGAFDMTLTGESMKSNKATDTEMSYDALKKWQQAYLPSDLKTPLLSPVYADLSSLPPLLLLASRQDPWFSDSVTVATKIQQTGGEARLRVWDNMQHLWIMDSSLTESQQAMREIANFAH